MSTAAPDPTLKKKKKKGEVNAYGYGGSALSRRARCAGLPRVHRLTDKVIASILDTNVRNALRVAATRASIAKHHTVQLGYIADGIKMASGVLMLGHRASSKHWKSAVSSRKKKDAKKQQPSENGTKGSGRGPGHTLRTYVYSACILVTFSVVLLCISWIMMSMDQFYDYKIPKRGASVPAMIAGVILLVMVLEVAALHDTLHKLWLEYRIERLHHGSDDPNAPLAEYSDQATVDAEIEVAARELAHQRQEARFYGDRSDLSGDD